MEWQRLRCVSADFLVVEVVEGQAADLRAAGLDQLKREQGRIAFERASLENRLNQATIEEARLFDALDRICELLTSGHALYLQSDGQGRRDLNQTAFERIPTCDDEVTSSDLMLPFDRVMSATLAEDLEIERDAGTTPTHTNTRHL